MNCGEERKLIFAKNDYPILECKTCGHRFIKIADHEAHLSDVYSDEYFFEGKDGYPNYLEQKDVLYEQGQRYAHLIARYTKPGKVLDVGCAAGFILKGFERAGWICYGIEPNETMAAYGREKLNLNIKTGSIESLVTNVEFDLVNLIQVIGHVHDPDKTLQNVVQVLKRSGLVLVESWNRSSFSARVLGKRWHEYSPPSVMHWYSDKTLALLFNYHGFTLIAKGYSVKKINVHHALTFLEGKISNIVFKKLLGWAERVTRRLVVINPLFDVKWYVFQKSE